jgi:hypothetical protein
VLSWAAAKGWSCDLKSQKLAWSIRQVRAGSDEGKRGANAARMGVAAIPSVCAENGDHSQVVVLSVMNRGLGEGER